VLLALGIDRIELIAHGNVLVLFVVHCRLIISYAGQRYKNNYEYWG
jgi:hypothetical protein